MMAKTKHFTLGDILSVITTKFLARDIGSLYTILQFVLGHPVFTHEIGEACQECAPELLRQFPQLAEVDASTVTPENAYEWLCEQKVKYGNRFKVTPMEPRVRTETPMESLARKRGSADGIMVVTK
jgi:hypothetical protein